MLSRCQSTTSNYGQSTNVLLWLVYKCPIPVNLCCETSLSTSSGYGQITNPIIVCLRERGAEGSGGEEGEERGEIIEGEERGRGERGEGRGERGEGREKKIKY